jgi:hypothetical protein
MKVTVQSVLFIGRFDRSEIVRTRYGPIVYFAFPAFELIAFINPLVPVVILAKNNRVLRL